MGKRKLLTKGVVGVVSHHHMEDIVQLMAEKWGGRVMPLGSPREAGSYAVWSVQGEAPRLHQVQEGITAVLGSPSLFLQN